MTSPRETSGRLCPLQDLQTAFASAVRFGDAAAIERYVDANGIEPARRVGIYANNVRENFLATLEATFPVLVRLAGRDWFRQTGTAYLRLHPSRSGNLHHVGERFAGYLEAELADGPYAYFADVARLEWAYQEVLVAADREALDLASLADVPADRHGDIVFELNPAARLVGAAYPLLRIWQANQPDAQSDDDIDGGDATLRHAIHVATRREASPQIDLASGPSRLLVIRRDDHVELRELPQGEFVFLFAITASEPLHAAAEAAQTTDPAFSLSESLVHAATLCVLSGFHVRPS
jgi:putative DNA-binding protein